MDKILLDIFTYICRALLIIFKNGVNHEGNAYYERKNLEFCILLWNIFPFDMSGHRNT